MGTTETDREKAKKKKKGTKKSKGKAFSARGDAEEGSFASGKRLQGPVVGVHKSRRGAERVIM